jgi:hypothetical protein
MREYRKANREGIRGYYAKNADALKEYARQYRIRYWLRLRKYFQENRRCKEERATIRNWQIAKAWMEANPEKMATCPLYHM